MPQMAPINWVSLFIMFCMIFLMFNSMNYFMFTYTPKSTEFKMKKFPINWKW
uniref:ATP synthase complex subunit 8 n=1 Tax=Eulichas sp. BMNH 840452 TaxID=904164 RepID=E3VT62_9COLE|nr:ATP synthase F0 subunit 8 [Eulichas sp. BMNH 840452]